MSRSMLILAVALAAYCLVGIAVSLFVALVWRTRAVAPFTLPPATRARRIFLLRLAPVVLSAIGATFFVVPAFIRHEPMHAAEEAGPLLVALACLGAAQLAVAVFTAFRSLVVTARLQRSLLDAGRYTMAREVPTVIVNAASPMVALVGIFNPTLVATRDIVTACNADELARIAAHKRGHVDARDNVCRWLMTALPDAVRWSRVHDEMVEAWHQAAEDAADDVATGDDASARADLAAVLLKVVRLAPRRMWSDAVISAFLEDDRGLERRVRRLVKSDREAPPPLAMMPMITAGAMAVAAAALASSPAAVETLFDAFEALVAFGR